MPNCRYAIALARLRSPNDILITGVGNPAWELSQMSELRTITTLLTTDAAGAFRPIGNENLGNRQAVLVPGRIDETLQ